MKHHSLFLWAVAGLAFTLHPVQAEEHDWTNKEGQTIRAEFVSVTSDAVTISMQGKTFVVKI